MRLSSNKKIFLANTLFSPLKIPKMFPFFFEKVQVFLVMAIPPTFWGEATWNLMLIDISLSAMGDLTTKVERCQCPRTPVSPYCAWGWQLWRGFQRELPDAWHLQPDGNEALGFGV